MRRWATLLALLLGVAVAGCDTIHGQASAGGGANAASRSGLFILGSGIRF
jgi:hypothetical protein